MRSRGVKKIFVGNPRLTIAQTNISFLFLNSFVYLKPYSTATNIVDYFQHIQIYTDYFLPMGRILTIFNAIAKNEGISISALEKSIGASKGVLSRALKHGTDIQVKWLIALVENYPDYNPDWILTGKEPMLRHRDNDGLHHMKEEGETYRLRGKIAILEERIETLKTANEALKENNDSLKEIKQLLQKRIEVLEGQ